MRKLKVLPAIRKINPRLLEKQVVVALVGCGGNGSQMLTKLARLNFALCELGHPGGLQVLAFDPDTVTQANVGRQLFSPADVGLYKCQVLINRINCYYGVRWEAFPEKYSGEIQSPLGAGTFTQPDLLITCVDTAKGRRDIHGTLVNTQPYWTPAYWLDLGNKKSDGQVILGEPPSKLECGTVSSGEWVKGKSKPVPPSRLPMVTEVFPELLDANLQEDDAPSCSLRDALDKQSLFVNDHITTWAAQLLDTLFRTGQITYHGAFINLDSGRVNPLRVPAPDKAQAAQAA